MQLASQPRFHVGNLQEIPRAAIRHRHAQLLSSSLVRYSILAPKISTTPPTSSTSLVKSASPTCYTGSLPTSIFTLPKTLNTLKKELRSTVET